MLKRIRNILIIATLAIITLLLLLLNTGAIWLESPSYKKYPVRGIDVSHYQGTIDWEKMQEQNIAFAFIKATEGSSSKDEKFQENWDKANATSIRIGAYHFFSYDSEGKTQAENFIKTVPKEKNTLPPVVDVEFYGDKYKNLPKEETVRKELDIFLTELEAHYGCKPIIYTTRKAYQLYIGENYASYPLWIRNVHYHPFLLQDRKWLFWQYTDSAVLDGYNGEETYIDMNIFNGSREEFEQLYPQ